MKQLALIDLVPSPEHKQRRRADTTATPDGKSKKQRGVSSKARIAKSAARTNKAKVVIRLPHERKLGARTKKQTPRGDTAKAVNPNKSANGHSKTSERVRVLMDILAPVSSARPRTKANGAMVPDMVPFDAFRSKALTRHAFYADPNVLILNMHVNDGLELLAANGIYANCIVTSPPFYGQRDYEVERQIGLEEHPSAFVANLATAFSRCLPVLAPNGSLWINIGDTYWSGKGEHKSGEAKQNARRFGLRPQDRKGDGKWCVPKQLLLIPHRLAIALQERGWIVRNDNVWVKPNPIPDQVRDRCSISHEYVFHFVKQRWYYFNKELVGRRGQRGTVLPPLDTWEVPPVRSSANHKARFSEDLVRIPILSTTPPGGVVLDPFAGSGTSLMFARKHGLRAIGIDIKREFCELMTDRLRSRSD